MINYKKWETRRTVIVTPGAIETSPPIVIAPFGHFVLSGEAVGRSPEAKQSVKESLPP
jgi:hypothetical protein